MKAMTMTITLLRKLIAEWEELIDKNDTSLTVQLLALADLRELIDVLRKLASMQERAAIRQMTDDRYEVAGVFAQKVRGTRRYSNWDDAEVGRRVLAHLQDGGGDVLAPSAVLGGLLRAARPTWRTTTLREMRIDFEDLVDVTTTPPHLFLHAATSDALRSSVLASPDLDEDGHASEPSDDESKA